MTHSAAIGSIVLTVAVTCMTPESSEEAHAGADRGPGGTIHNITQNTFHVTIQEAIDLAVGGDEIEVGPGTYVELIDLLGKAISLRSSDGPGATILDGAAASRVINCVSGEGPETVIEGFTIANGSSFGAAGGMYCYSSSPTVTDCTFSGNWATGGGAMSVVNNSSPTLNNCTFSDNSAVSGGAGMACSDSSPTLTNCTFNRNWTTVGNGGGMLNSNSSPTLTDCTFSENSVMEFGGGMYNEDASSPTLTNCTFSRNGSDGGGGMDNDTNSSPTLTNCTFSGNSATYGGGMRNRANSNPTLTNCTFSGNNCFEGSGIYSDHSNPTLANCILWGNTSAFGSQIVDIDAATVATYSCIQDGWSGVGNVDADPLFVDADGPDGVFGTADDDLHLLDGSPCINTGDNAAVPVEVTTDFEGDDRIRHCRVDMGVDETSFIGPDCNNNGVPDACDLEGGASADCNANQTPDECDISSEASEDCNGNVIPDECEPGGLEDCNTNDVPDLCDIFDGTSEDCNTNAVPDNCDIADGTSTDCNNNGLPDECEGLTRVYVEDDAIGGLNHGSSWTDAYLELADALSYAVCADVNEIHVAGGTYKPGTLRTDTFQLINGVAIRGGYRGLAGGGDPNDRDIALYETILSGDIGVHGNTSDNSYHVVTGSGTNEAATLDGFTITEGIARSTVTNGGGMFNDLGSPTVANCTFTGNEAKRGGGMYNSNSSPTLSNCTFRENMTFNDDLSSGGGMYNHASNPTLRDCTFIGNSANGDTSGGGMVNDGSSPTLINCTFSGNSADQASGGGIHNSNSSPTLTNCTFSGNSAASGGGMRNLYSNPTLINCAFSGNSAFTGGGMFQTRGNATLTNCTFSGNSANTAGGIYIFDSSPVLANCIVWANLADSEPEISGPAMVTHSCIGGGWQGEGNISGNPLFNVDFQLTRGSPCIDAGRNDAVPADAHDLDGDGNTTEPLPLDLFGRSRFFDDPTTDDTGVGDPPIVDMGAHEFHPPLLGDLDGDGDVDLDDFKLFQLQFGGP